jgi:enamidase
MTRSQRISTRLLLLVLGISLAAACQPDATLVQTPTATAIALPEGVLVIHNGTVVDGTGAPPIPHGLVAIEGEEIVAVGPAAGFAIPETATRLDVQGGTILPGIVNAHTHRNASAAARRAQYLLEGVTTVCNLGEPLTEITHFLETRLRDKPAARVFWTGPSIAPPGGYLGAAWGDALNYEVTSPAEARAAVADLAARGASLIKVALEPGARNDPWPVLSPAELATVVEEAHVQGLLVRAHIGRTDGTGVLELALESGVDTIEHVPKPIFSVKEAYDHLLAGSLPPLSVEEEAALAALAQAGVILVPTLEAETLWCQSPQVPDEQRPACYEFYLERVRRYQEMGGTIALGNDAGADPALETGMPLQEMRRLQEAGLTPIEVLTAATRNAAAACNASEMVGTLEPGKLADLIVVAGDPLADLQAMGQVTTVVLGGEIAVQRDVP